MIATIFAFLASPIGKTLKPVAGVLLVLALLGLALYGVHHAGYKSGVAAEKAAQARAIEKAQKRALEAEKQSAAITDKTEARHALTVGKIRTVTKTLIKEVPYAVPSDPTRASLSVGFVRLHDAAATGVPGLPDPAGRSDAEATGVTDADLARTIIPNYETCRISAETVTAWQSWVTDQAALYNRTIGEHR